MEFFCLGNLWVLNFWGLLGGVIASRFFEKRRGNPLNFFWGVGFVGTLGKFVILSAAKNPKNFKIRFKFMDCHARLVARSQ